MKALILALVCSLANAAPAFTDQDAQTAHANGTCGSLGPGTGLSADGKGWVVSMLPGPHEFRIAGGGFVGVTVAKVPGYSFDAGRPYYIEASDATRLEWKVPGRDWGPVSKLFLYPTSKHAAN